jgi:predicted flap endonuclease-1-like 5' DNA nuclease
VALEVAAEAEINPASDPAPDPASDPAPHPAPGAAAETAPEPKPEAPSASGITAAAPEGPPASCLLDVAAAEATLGAPAPIPLPPGLTAATDLSAIPELGPGMRHRLAQLGYRTCGDLAEADPALLARQLGEISRMLRLDRWINAARALR